ncbi:hypothetical protein SS50377_27394 [Spironucleus salmonicida]|uniref:Uncharacterized protein n=1 Tax=Spironucleus salmonicida TaxID=348837 RepID=V6LRA6_9EUKA|nr:hypothetical protein SS50377_27386 [Spironucleus salmonicida]KAH0571092.1 hypothetical protein SS50377_27388 [Spironucleus salmonicida]KAH0571093.1 hypothetical protein SS50377_27390 [Spironucleus salmonicida]KAH0571094.1 hypothetical protein SS50377_27392 [Spironucleus salmonicida]KAH0571095.1 hypothetical protein SS50377_27394 [Spironucleus salmonicida]|eukprot:EST43314.1 Hypothetical protein SS50377_16987 [Spironucleus salmonicida]
MQLSPRVYQEPPKSPRSLKALTSQPSFARVVESPLPKLKTIRFMYKRSRNHVASPRKTEASLMTSSLLSDIEKKPSFHNYYENDFHQTDILDNFSFKIEKKLFSNRATYFSDLKKKEVQVRKMLEKQERQHKGLPETDD